MANTRVLVVGIVLLGLTMCLLVGLTLLSNPIEDTVRAATQTAEKRRLDEYLTMYSPGGITGIAPSREPTQTLQSIRP
ncbi:MAG: hypothetical protein IT324_26525 [Anaerolineae bacterium]|nr:hypothetical protein [Anaerolineae bacterium]